MDNTIFSYPDCNLNFKTISDFQWCMKTHGEVQFDFGGKSYSITHSATGKIRISESFHQETECLCDTVENVLDYKIGKVCLRDIITEVEVTERTI